MATSHFRLKLFSGFLGHGAADQVLKPIFRNFGVCPHCQKTGGPFLLDRLVQGAAGGPMISRSDGEHFHLVLGDRPISFPAEKSSGKSEMKSVGFWYVNDRRDNGPASRTTDPPREGTTETVVVILRNPPQSKLAMMRHIELVADKLAEKLAKPGRLESLYDFDGTKLQRGE